MDEWALDRIAEWKSEPFESGVAGLHRLAESGFTGAIESGQTVVLMLNGRVIARYGGALESVDSGTLNHAPDPGLPLLLAMRAANGTQEGRYYTEETSLTSVHETLASGGFTGYLELSENVLSGDYYVLYYGGRSLPVAFVGASRRCLTGDDAFDRAADEVGIFEVRSVDLAIESLPPLPDEPASEPATEPEPPDDDTETAAEEVEPEPTADVPPEEKGSTDSVFGSSWTDENDPPPARSAGDGALPSVLAIPSIDPDRSQVERSEQPMDHPPAEEQAETTADVEKQSRPPETQTAEATERDDLADQVESLEAELERLRSDATSAPEPPQADTGGPNDLDPAKALRGSHLFVRYHTRGGSTIESAVEHGEDGDDVRENLLLERHTAFDADETTVAGEPFDEFFEGQLAVRFTRWLLQDLLFEIDETNSRGALADLVSALAEIDRIDFNETVEGTDDHRFDVVARNRMGTPVVVADVDPGRSPTAQSTLTELIAASTEVAAADNALGAAFVVTESFFEPGALEAAREATSGGLLSRSDKKAYVRVSRGVGYHMCLVECRSETFHVTLPTM